MPRGKIDFTVHRYNAFVELFWRIVKSRPGNHIDVRQIATQMCCAGAPRFWISEERALRVVRTALRTGQLPPLRTGVRNMYTDLLNTVHRLLDTTPDLTLTDAVYRAVNSPAPNFYYSPEYARCLIYRLLRKA